MKKLVVLVLLAAVIGTGCTGSFIFTQKVYNFHRELDDKWMDEVGFLICAILPIYGIAVLADSVILNSVEFWTGENPAGMAASERQKVIEKDGRLAVMELQDDGSIRVKADGKAFVLERGADGIVARDADGDTAYKATTLQDGQVAVRDESGRLVGMYR